MDKGIWKIFDYGLRNCGGLFWPLLYGILFFNSWIALNDFGHYIFMTFGIIMFCIGLLYPYAWSRYYKKMHNDYKKMIKEKVRDLFEWLKNKDSMGLLASDKTVQDLRNSLQRFEWKYFSEKNES